MKEYKVGTILERDGVYLQVFDDVKNCKSCYFNSSANKCTLHDPQCIGMLRKDHTTIYYKKIESPEEV